MMNMGGFSALDVLADQAEVLFSSGGRGRGGSIGAGLFVGSGGALAKGGPAALLICFSIIGIVSRPLACQSCRDDQLICK